MKALKTMQKSLKWMLFLLVCVVIAAAVLGGLFVKQRLDDRAARQAEYERVAKEKADEITLTFAPGNTIFTARRMLISRGFSEAEIDAAFSKDYEVMTKMGRPAALTGVDSSMVAGAKGILNTGSVSIEGFLFPETINFFAMATVEQIVTRMATELDRAIQREGLAQRFGDQQINNRPMTLYEGLVMASIVQKEAGGLKYEDKTAIAAVFYNRLRMGWPLGADATTLYAADMAGIPTHNEDGSANWSILQLSSPWNTRGSSARVGLPPTPIASPGLEAIRAAANPDFAKHRYTLYFLTDDNDVVRYATNEAGHQENIRTYCQIRCQNW
ncbi:endolytic transglycosylase MltG [Candidatus Saccharibacteria bacterium]|nr:endolytic transglycosylase MltG [Candidatus Saccharibacteria bacterium]